MVIVMALGGSTNAVLHLIAMAKAFDIDLTIDDFQDVSMYAARFPCTGGFESDVAAHAGVVT